MIIQYKNEIDSELSLNSFSPENLSIKMDEYVLNNSRNY